MDNQVAPLQTNGYRPECIFVEKVYDWVLVNAEFYPSITVPEACRAGIAASVAAGDNVTVSITFVSTNCQVVSVTPFPSSGNNIGRVVLRKDVVLRFQYINNTSGSTLCDFTTDTISFQETVCVCFSDGLSLDNVSCSILATGSEVVGPIVPAADGSITVQVDLCQEVQVQDFVNLEVMARFCAPRENDIECGTIPCTFPGFPEQCPDIFPR
ncbi:hypothetical protein LRR81_13345 [Metabacillus sp. GX 13764]|uniref:hypothetical protein n=1 Tax=Metabacillus kandeliae TaxID=2900151 RepID=UPI001E57100D|nr:hypothetical protein [Metabacillus kandeliae]MCD7035226.1 hypothetical protein [Metabacillus kandeliae]